LLDRTPEDCIAFILKKEPLFKAGKGFAYSDTNYLILGLIIEEVTGKSYNTLLRNFLAEHSFMNTDPSDSRILDGLVQGYIAQNVFNLPVEIVQNGELSINPAFEWTGGGTVTTASDLAKLAFLIHGNRLLDSTHYDLFVHPVNMRSGQVSDSGYGLGTFVWISGNDVKYGHSGFFPGYQSHVEYSTKYQYAISIQLNTDDGNINLRSITSKLEEILHKHMDAIDEEKIMANFAKQEACWNKNDILCYMEAYASDRLVETNSSRGVIYGYDKILDSYQNNYPADKMGMLHFDQLTTRKLSSSFYHVTGRYNLSDKTNDATRQGWFSAVMEKIRGDWYMITDHSS
jgi:D-alanyl-D-alanine carboxypeptidase